MNPSDSRRVNLYLNVLVLVMAFSIPIYRKWVVVAASLVIILWFVEGRLREKLRVLRRHPLTLSILLFVLLNVVSLLWSSDPAAGLSYLGKYRYLLLVPVIATSLREPYRHRTIAAFMLGMFAATLFSFAVFLNVFRIGEAYPGNPSPPNISHLDFSMMLAVAALLVINRLAHDALDWPRRILWLCLLACFVGGLLINIGRSGQLALAGTLVVMVPVYLARRSPRAAGFGLAAVLAALTVAYASVPRFHRGIAIAVDELRQTVGDQQYQGNLGKRVAGMRVASDMIRERPLFGYGVGGNMVEFRRLLETEHRDLEQAIGWFPHLHNQYLQITTELGLVGLSAMLLLFFALIRGPYRNQEDRHLALILGCVYLIGSVGDPFLHKQLPLVLLATLSGVAAARGRSQFSST